MVEIEDRLGCLIDADADADAWMTATTVEALVDICMGALREAEEPRLR